MPQQRAHPAQAGDSCPQSPPLPLKWKRGVLARRFATKSTLTPLPTSNQMESIAGENMPVPGEHSSHLEVCLRHVLQQQGKKSISHHPVRLISCEQIILICSLTSLTPFFLDWLAVYLTHLHCCFKYQFGVSE